MAAVEAPNPAAQARGQIGRFALGRFNFWLLAGFQLMCATLVGAVFAHGAPGGVPASSTLWQEAVRLSPPLWAEVNAAIQAGGAVDWAGAARLWAGPMSVIGLPVLGLLALAWELARSRTPHVLQLAAALLCWVPIVQFAMLNSAAAPLVLPKGAVALAAAGVFLAIAAFAHRPRDAAI